MTTKEFIGAELEMAYARILGGKVNGGFNDGGLDVITNDVSVPAIQVKSSMDGACKFLAEAMKRHQYIPIAIGDPGTKDEVLSSLKKFGAWIGRNIARREELLQKICQVQQLCQA